MIKKMRLRRYYVSARLSFRSASGGHFPDGVSALHSATLNNVELFHTLFLINFGLLSIEASLPHALLLSRRATRLK